MSNQVHSPAPEPQNSNATRLPVPSVGLGRSSVRVAPVALGAWPMAGVSTLDVEDSQSIATIHRALDLGVTMIDTAYSYGFDGRSDRVIAQAIAGRRDQVVLASKVGGSLDAAGKWQADGAPERLIEQAKTVLQRLGVEAVDILYLHAPDPSVPLEESADTLREIVARGWAKHAAVSNVSAAQLAVFHARCPVIAVQTYFNMLQPEKIEELRPYCQANGIGAVVYWVFMKGLLAGKLDRKHAFDAADRRLTYAVYQGERWEVAQALLDALKQIAQREGRTVASLVVAWTLRQLGISAVLVGAKRPVQIEESAAAMHESWSDATLGEVDRAVAVARARYAGLSEA
ncbi:MAG: aldo/keto reductase [Pirellula sp.]